MGELIEEGKIKIP